MRKCSRGGRRGGLRPDNTLANRDLDARDADLDEDSILDVFGRRLCVLEVESVGLHADPHQERAERLSIPDVADADVVDRIQPYFARFEQLDYLFPYLVRRVCDRDIAVSDGAQLSAEARRLRPGGTRLEEALRPAWQPVEVGISIGIYV